MRKPKHQTLKIQGQELKSDILSPEGQLKYPNPQHKPVEIYSVSSSWKDSCEDYGVGKVTAKSERER